MKQTDKFVIMEKAHFDSTFFPKTETLSPYRVKQEIRKPSLPQNQSTFRRNKSLPPPNGLSIIENATKIYRVPSNRVNGLQTTTTNFDSETEDDSSQNVDDKLLLGSSVTKPTPPSAVTLKYNSSILTKPRRDPRAVSKKTKREKLVAIEKDEEPERKRMFESNVLSAQLLNKPDVLSSLKTLSLIEPFLGNAKMFQTETKSASKLHVPLNNYDLKRNGLSGYAATAHGSRNNLQHSNIPRKGLKHRANLKSSSWTATTIDKNSIEVENKCIEESHNATKTNCPSPPDGFTNDMLYLLNGNGAFEPRKDDYVDTSDNESFVYRDAYNNRISVKKVTNVKPGHDTPISIVASLNEAPKPANKRQSYLTQRQLSFVGATVPTATVVDISTGNVVEDDSISSATEETELQQIQRLRSGAGSKTSVPTSFYYNRKINRRKQEDRAEMIELNKLKDKARDDIKSILNRIDSPESQKSSQLDNHDFQNRQVPLKRPIEYKVVRLPSPSQVVFENNTVKPLESSNPEPVSSRCSSTLTTSSSSSSLSSSSIRQVQPPAPNPSPQLASNRFQLFPTTNPNAFHAYTSSSSQPTVISMDHFCLAKASLIDQGNDKSKAKPSASQNRKAGTGGIVRVLTSSDNRLKRQDVLKNNTLVKGQSINFKNQSSVSDTDACTDNEMETNEEHLKSSEDDSDGKKSLHVPPKHATNKFFRISNSGAAIKVKKPKDDNSDVVTYTPLQSLVIKSCQSVNPIVVIPELENESSNEEMNRASPSRTHTVDGHISPLKGVRILRRKVTIRHYDNEAYPYGGKIGHKTLFSDSQKPKQNIVEYLDDKTQTRYGSKAFNVYSPPAEKLNPIRAMSEERNGRLPRQQPDTIYNPMSRKLEEMKKSINIDKLYLGKDSSMPFLLLKEGAMQSLNFINPNAIHFSLAPLSKQDAKDAAERSAKRRRKIQLGSNGGTDDCVSVKIAAGGGFKSNVARYSLLLRQKYHKLQEEPAQKQLQQEEMLEISKTGIEPLNKSDKHLQKILERNLSSESDTLPDVTESNNNPKVISPNDDLPSRSRLQIRDLLDNLCTNGEVLDNNSPNGIRNDMRSTDINEQDLENCRKHLSFTKSPSLNDLDTTGQLDNSSLLPDTSTTAYRLSRDVSFSDESKCHGDALNSIQKQDQQLLNGFVGRPVVFSRNEHHSDAVCTSSRLEKNPSSITRENSEMEGYQSRNPAPFTLPPQDRRKHRFTGNYNLPRGVHSSFSNSYPATIRMSKDAKPNWSHRMEDFSDSKPGCYGSDESPEGNEFDIMTGSPIQPSRNKPAITIKSRSQSKYISFRNSTSSNRKASYADPFVGAPTSFQQRLAELSMLESDTIKSEKNRKLKRKSKQQDKDKDS